MSTWYYYNKSGEKIEVTGAQLKELAKQGTVTRDTIVETEEGKSSPARRVKGLTFLETTQPESGQEVTHSEAKPTTSTWYYYNEDGERIAVTGGQLKGLAKAGMIMPGTLVETEDGKKTLAKTVKGLTFVAAVATQQTPPAPVPPVTTENYNVTSSPPPFTTPDPFAATPVNPFAPQSNPLPSSSPFAQPIPVVSVSSSAIPQTNSLLSKTFNRYFMWYWICVAAMIPTCGITQIGAMIFMFVLLYQAWKLIPADIARTTPGTVVGFGVVFFLVMLLFPFWANFLDGWIFTLVFFFVFSAYLSWMFIAFKGLGEDMNKTLMQREIPYRVKESLGLICSITSFGFVLGFACFVNASADVGLIVNGLMFLAFFIVSIFFFKSVKNGAIALIEQNST